MVMKSVRLVGLGFGSGSASGSPRIAWRPSSGSRQPTSSRGCDSG